MDKPVDGAEARLRDAATSIQLVVGVATGDLRDMLAHSAALVAENERQAAEIARLRSLLIDPGDPAWEDARAVLVSELRKAGLNTHADNIAVSHAVPIPSWIALNLIAQAARSLGPRPSFGGE